MDMECLTRDCYSNDWEKLQPFDFKFRKIIMYCRFWVGENIEKKEAEYRGKRKC